MELFKKRNFSELMGDSFAFFKQNGKHYFRNYFVINGPFLLILLALLYFIVKVYFEVLFSAMGTGRPDLRGFGLYFNNNLGLIIAAFIVLVLLALLISILQYAFPVIYLQLYEKNKGTGFSAKDILVQLKSKTGKILVFFIASVFIFLPLLFIAMGISFLLIFILIGIPLLMIVFPAFISWISLSFYTYLNEDAGYFEALGNALRYLRKNFWTIVGVTLLMYFIIQVLLTVISMIPYAIGFISMLSTVNSSGGFQKDGASFFVIMMIVTLELSFALNYIFSNLLLISQGLTYYSAREETENTGSQSEIETIGTHFE